MIYSDGPPDCSDDIYKTIAMPRTPAPTKAEPAICRAPAPELLVAFEAEAEAAEEADEEAELTLEEAELRAAPSLLVTLAMRELAAAESVTDPMALS